jgi:hypothetical protein
LLIFETAPFFCKHRVDDVWGKRTEYTLAPKRKILGGLRSLPGAVFRVYCFEIKGNDAGGTTREMNEKYLLENLKGRRYLEDQGVVVV